MVVKSYDDKGRFVKGIIPWNTGKINVYSEEMRQKMGAKNKGRLLPPLPSPRPCKKCGRTLDAIQFKKSNRGNVCKKCDDLRVSEWCNQHPENLKVSAKKANSTLQNKERMNKWQREKGQKNKIKIINHYSRGSMKCKECGFNDIRALSVDHIDGGGCKHRKSIGRDGGRSFYTWIIKNNYPDGFQILCFNCQSIKRFVKGEGVNIEV